MHQDLVRFPIDLTGKTLTEKEWQKTVRQTATGFGWRAYHTAFSFKSDPGYPDDHFWHPGPVSPMTRLKGGFHGPVAFLVEYKKQTGKTTEKQDDCIQSLRDAGYKVYVWRPSDWPEVVEVLSFGRARAA